MISKKVLKVTRPIVNIGSVMYKGCAMGIVIGTLYKGYLPTPVAIFVGTELVLHLVGKLSRVLKLV